MLDASILDFEMGLRDLVSDVENAYWDLYFAYRNLEAKIAAAMRRSIRGGLKQVYREQKSDRVRRNHASRAILPSPRASARGADGQEVDGTRTNNGSSGGTFRARRRCPRGRATLADVNEPAGQRRAYAATLT